MDASPFLICHHWAGDGEAEKGAVYAEHHPLGFVH